MPTVARGARTLAEVTVGRRVFAVLGIRPEPLTVFCMESWVLALFRRLDAGSLDPVNLVSDSPVPLPV